MKRPVQRFRARNGRVGWSTVVVASGLGAIAVATTTLAIGQGAGERSYEGTLAADASTLIGVTIGFEGGRGQAAAFEAENVPVLCEGETTARRDFLPITAKFEDTQTFEGRRYNPPSEAGARQLFKVKGRLLGGGRASGFLFYFDEECSTDGLVRWTAARVR